MKKVAGALLVALVLAAGGFGASMAVLAATTGNIISICRGAPVPTPTSMQVVGELMPEEVDGYTGAQLANAAIIIALAQQRGLSVNAARIALITAIQESSLRNLANSGGWVYPAGGSTVMTEARWNEVQKEVTLSLTMPNDGVAFGNWDSIGAFQQRLSVGYGGTGSIGDQVKNLLTISYTAGAFYDRLVAVPGWQDMAPTTAAQAVQRSAWPDAYAAHWDQSADLVQALTGVAVPDTSAGACSTPVSSEAVSATGWTRPITSYKLLSSAFGLRLNPVSHIYKLHEGQDFAADRGTPIYAAAAGTVIKAGRAGVGNLNWVVIDHGGGLTTGYLHSDDGGILVKVGQPVKAGEQIALVGNSGDSTGPHLHFEVRTNGTAIEPLGFLTLRGVTY